MDNNITINDEQANRFADTLKSLGLYKWTKAWSNYGYRYSIMQGDNLFFYNFLQNRITKNLYIVSAIKQRYKVKVECECTLDEIQNIKDFNDVIKSLQGLDNALDESGYSTKINWETLINNTINFNDADKEIVDNTFNVDEMMSKYEW